MKTVAGRAILARNSKKMDKLNSDFLRLARRLKAMRKADTPDELLKAARENRQEHERLQAEISLTCLLESYL